MSTLLALSTTQLVLLALALAIAYFLYSYRDYRAIGTRPRPDLVPLTKKQTFLLGDLPAVLRDRKYYLGRFWQSQVQCAHLLKDEKGRVDPSKAFTVTLPGLRMVLISKAEHIAHVQRDAFGNYEKGPLFRRSMQQVLGDGIFVVDGHQWHLQRKATSKIFTANNFKGIITTSIQTHLGKLLSVIGRHADRGESFDLADLFFRFTLDSFTEMAFGKSTGALETDEPVPFAVAFDYAQGVMDSRFNNPFSPITERLNGTKTKMDEAVRILDEFAYEIISQREIEGRDGKSGADTDLLSLYMALRDESGEPLSRSALRDALLNLIIAGRDTTAQGLSWTMFRLLREPQYFAPMRAEVAQLGKEVEEIDYELWRNAMPRTTATFYEGLRLHPSVPKNAWQAKADDVLPNGGPRVEKGDFISWNDWIRARDPDIWGPDAAAFKPSRFLGPDNRLVRPDEWTYHVFNGGRRLCLGMNLALFEGSAVLAALSSEFEWEFEAGYLDATEMCEMDNTPLYRPSLTLLMAAPLRVRATRRTSA